MKQTECLQVARSQLGERMDRADENLVFSPFTVDSVGIWQAEVGGDGTHRPSASV
jgi:hypothetical protein